MLLTPSLPLFAPPPASLLPPLSLASSDQQPVPQLQPHQHPSRRPKQHASALRNSTLAVLAADERSIAQRKMAIAMYGYGWLKPAGCAKTMLGRREEEVEREEVERQLREVELQERAAQEAEEQERLARLAETGEPDDGRDLDEDIPDMDAEGIEGEEGDEVDLDEEIPDMDAEDDEDGMEGDLDDEIPEADDENDEDEEMSPYPDESNANWVYDSRREPDTDEETQDANPSSPGHTNLRPGHFRHGTAIVAGVRVPVPGSEYDYDEREAEDMANAMLDEDEIFDDDDELGERDLDDEVPEPESEQGWEHTDTELEDSEMDISMLPASATGGHIAQRRSLAGQRRSDVRQPTGSARRRSSGPWIADPSPSTQESNTDWQSSAGQRGAPRARMVSGNLRQQRQYLETPDTRDFSPTSGADTHDQDESHQSFNTSIPHTLHHHLHTNRGTPAQETGNSSENPSMAASRNPTGTASPSTRNAARTWLDGAAAAVGGSARRTLFGRATRRTNAAAAGSSGGLFTPSPHVGPGAATDANAPAGVGTWDDTPVTHSQGQDRDQEPARQHQRRRSGRFLGGRRRAE